MPDIPISPKQTEKTPAQHEAELSYNRAQARLAQGKEFVETDDSQNNIDPEDFKEAKLNAPSKPSFPVFIFTFAIIKDIVDFAELTIIGIILSWIFTIIFAIIVWVWCRGKVGFIKKFIIRRLALMIAIGLIPILGLIPEASIFILWIHFREVKYIGNILQTLETLESAK